MSKKNAKQQDNSTLDKKVALRRAALREIANPSIVETHGGAGMIFKRCYASHRRGVVFETDERKAEYLSTQRPGWAVYGSDSAAGIAAGAGFQFAPNFFDVDPYGDCWPTVAAIFAGMQRQPVPAPKLVIVVNDGLRQKVRLKGGWSASSIRSAVEKHGNDRLYKIYLDVCREMMAEMAAANQYRLSRWTGYYCGQDMTHFAAVLEATS